MTAVSIELNGVKISDDVEPRLTLADFLRDHCGLTATHLGCEHGACGACTVVVDGEPTRSCLSLAVMCDGRSVFTLEGLHSDGLMEIVRRHFHECHALQCGFCTPGMLIMACDILRRHKRPDEKTIRHELSGPICRCTGYSGIVKAILASGQELGNIADAAAAEEARVAAAAAAATEAAAAAESAAEAAPPSPEA